LLTKEGRRTRKALDEEGIKSIMEQLGSERRAKETELKEAIVRRDEKVSELKRSISKDSGKLRHARKLHNVACIAAMSDEEAGNQNNIVALLRINRSAYFYAKALARKLKSELPNGTYEQYKNFMLNDKRFKDNFKEIYTIKFTQRSHILPWQKCLLCLSLGKAALCQSY
jgi:hypothetical protein